ncbi:hypothetical protein GCM10011418_21800 [Sphingobacterium alkalisoli]|uniref:hypothetical protein n=1 Tax=Sphingobacterium alkalisoli TaxID=1874115 RepID=UPI00145D84D8|nr:hypothetical protein [Sphingobacterium alkalisoli]GGH18272.1 hypothetical protein GCM10011418_21800 [Sphingobacterium alkalisoli]
MRSIINKISRAVQVVLLAPIKLPGKALNILKYVAVGLGIIESVLDNGKEGPDIGKQELETGKQGSDNGKQELDIEEQESDIAKEERDEAPE